MGHQDGSVDQGSYSQTWQPKFDSWDPHDRRKEQTPSSCPLTSSHGYHGHGHAISSPTHIHSHSLSYTHAGIIKIFKNVYLSI